MRLRHVSVDTDFVWVYIHYQSKCPSRTPSFDSLWPQSPASVLQWIVIASLALAGAMTQSFDVGSILTNRVSKARSSLRQSQKVAGGESVKSSIDRIDLACASSQASCGSAESFERSFLTCDRDCVADFKYCSRDSIWITIQILEEGANLGV